MNKKTLSNPRGAGREKMPVNEVKITLHEDDIKHIKNNLSDTCKSMSSYIRALIDKDMGVSNGQETENFI